MSDQDKGPDSGSPRAQTRRQTYKGGWELTGQIYEMWCTRQRNRRSKAAAGRRTHASALSYDSRQKMQAKAAWERILQKRLPHPWLYVEHMRNDDRDARLVYHHERSLEFAAARRQEKAARRAAHRERLSQGFVWRGGTVGGNDRYQQKPFQHAGLVSDQHPILLFFASKLPKGRGLVCGDDNAVIGPAPHRSKLLGCDKAYVAGNAKVRGFLRVDIDRPLSVSDIQKACRTAGIPLPNIAVGHADASGTLLNPHLLWLLEQSVTFTDQGLPRFRSLFNAVLRGLTVALVPYGADRLAGVTGWELNQRLQAIAWSVSDFARFTGMTDRTIRDIIHGYRDGKIALALARALELAERCPLEMQALPRVQTPKRASPARREAINYVRDRLAGASQPQPRV